MAENAQQKRESTEDRRAAIALAARALIAEKGVEGLRTRDIAERVGINIATLHYHVPTKEALIGLVAETMKTEFRAQTDARPRSHLPPLQQLDHEFYDFHETLTQRPETIAAMGELTERARRDPVVHAAVAPMQHFWHRMIADILAAGRADGTFRPDMESDAAATMIIGTLIFFARTNDQSDSSYERLCEELRRAVRHPDSMR
jgi:AcrR family transcriptional regulator